ncbi:MAG: DUF4349 domain-containing protein [Actinomycetota bacterium]|nr:DUF4349 domain-containing protein [Actinomycetota bacterium]
MRSRHLAMVLMLLAAVVAGCSSSGSDEAAEPAAQEEAGGSDGGGGASGGGAGGSGVEDRSADYMESETEGLSADGVDVSLKSSAMPERVIKTADLRLEVADGRLGQTLREGREIAEAAGGFLLSTSIDGVDRRRGEFVIRVPAERFEETLSALEELGTIAGEDVRGEDVSQEFVDLEARLRNATAQEEVLFRLYDRSDSIADTIRVQRELEDVQLEIERLRGRLRFLKDRTDLSTISVSLVETGVVTAEAGPFEKAWDTARKTFVAVVSGALVGAGFLLPIAAFALLAYVVFRLVRPRLQRVAE